MILKVLQGVSAAVCVDGVMRCPYSCGERIIVAYILQLADLILQGLLS